jgi:hypothetical protein
MFQSELVVNGFSLAYTLCGLTANNDFRRSIPAIVIRAHRETIGAD